MSKRRWVSGLVVWLAACSAVAQEAEPPGPDAPPADSQSEWADAAPPAQPEPVASESAPADTAPQDEALAIIPVRTPGPEPVEIDDSTELDEVVVTAQKRVQRLVDVPINVSAMDRENIEKVRIEQVRDVMGYIPNVDIKEQVPGAIPVVTIRGVGLDDFSSTNSPAAGIYVDQITLSSLALMSFDLFDMERIEVLKGPQGTLYGRNSNAGAINVITAAPTLEREGYLRAGYGSYEAKDLEAMYNLPLGDTLALRVAGKWIAQGEGLWESRVGRDEPYRQLGARYPSDAPIVRDIGKRDILLGRVRLAWDPHADLGIQLKVDGLRQRSEMGQPEFFGALCQPNAMPVDPQRCTDIRGYTDTDGDAYQGDWRGDFPYTIDQLGETLIVDWDLGWGALTAVSGHIDFERFFHIDVDGTPGDEFNFLQGDVVKQFSQELRLAGDGARGAWLAGLFFAQDNVKIDTPGRHQDLIPMEESRILADQDTRSLAAFANMDWKLIERLMATTGLRYTHEERSYVGGTDWTVNVPGVLDDTHEDSAIEDGSWSWKLGLSFAPTPASLLFAHVSKGIKSGGYFAGVTNNARQLEPYRPEQLLAYEVGGKLAGLFALNASAFYYQYTDLQTFMRDGSAPVQYVGNVPEAEGYGLDVDSTIRVVDGLTFIVGLGLLQTKLGAFTGPDGPDADQEGDPHPAGNKLANAPELTVNVLGRYEVPLFETGLFGALQADAHYADEMYKEATNDPLLKSEPYTLFNARLSLLPAVRDWEFALWGRNLTDERYVVQGANVTIFFVGNHNYNAPRTFGAELRWEF